MIVAALSTLLPEWRAGTAGDVVGRAGGRPAGSRIVRTTPLVQNLTKHAERFTPLSYLSDVGTRELVFRPGEAGD